MPKKEYKEPTSPLYKALISKLIEEYKYGVSSRNITISMSKEELIPIIGEDDFNNKLDIECSQLMYIRVESDHMVSTVCSSLSWNKKILSVEFSKHAIPYIIEKNKTNNMLFAVNSRRESIIHDASDSN